MVSGSFCVVSGSFCVVSAGFRKKALVSAEKPCWYPHDDVTVIKPISLVFLQQADRKAFHAGDHLLMCCSCMFFKTFS